MGFLTVHFDSLSPAVKPVVSTPSLLSGKDFELKALKAALTSASNVANKK